MFVRDYSPEIALEDRSTEPVELPHTARDPHTARLPQTARLALRVLLPHTARSAVIMLLPQTARDPHTARRSVMPVPHRLLPQMARPIATDSVPSPLSTRLGLIAGPYATVVEASAAGIFR